MIAALADPACLDEVAGVPHLAMHRYALHRVRDDEKETP